MTCVVGCVCSDGRVVVVSDSAISYGGYRRLMSEGKWWDMGCLLIGEAGSDFAISRIRAKTGECKTWEDLVDPYTFGALVREVQTEVKGQGGTESIEAELMHVSTTIHVVGGDGGISGPYPYTAIGDGMMPALPLMDALLHEKRIGKKRTVQKVTNALLEIMGLVASYVESVEAPFHCKVFNPGGKFKGL